MDIYLITCFLMVFAALVEYAAVSYAGKRMKMRRERIKRAAEAKPKESLILPNFAVTQMQQMQLSGGSRTSQKSQKSRKISEMSTFSAIGSDVCTCDLELGVAEDFREDFRLSFGKIAAAPSSKIPFWKREWPMFNASAIDKYSRIFFPLIALLLNTIYWSSYIYVSRRGLKEQMQHDS